MSTTLSLCRLATIAMTVIAAAPPALAQSSQGPLSPDDTVISELSRTATKTWTGKVTGWEKFEPRTYKITRDSDTVQTVRGLGALLRLDTAAFMVIPYPDGPAPEIVSTNTSRSTGAVTPSAKWSSRVTYIGQPADWCPQDLNSSYEGSYEVEPQESYALRIDGQELSLPVLPVVERGTWSRCYVGKRYQRFLWSPDLQTVLGIEFQTYDPRGMIHQASFAMRVKEIQRGKAAPRP